MQDILSDVVKYTTGVNKVDHIIFDGNDKETLVGAVDEDMTLYIKGRLNAAIPELQGRCAVGNLKMLKGLLNFGPYRSEGSKFNVIRHTRNDVEAPDQFEFRDPKGVGAIFKMMNLASPQVRDPGNVGRIPWDIEFEPDAEKLAAFHQLTSLFSSSTDKFFGVKTQGTDFIVTMGVENSSTHSGSMILAENINGSLKGEMHYSIEHFLSLVKLAAANATKLCWNHKGVFGITIETEYAVYNYYLRAKR